MMHPLIRPAALAVVALLAASNSADAASEHDSYCAGVALERIKVLRGQCGTDLACRLNLARSVEQFQAGYLGTATGLYRMQQGRADFVQCLAYTTYDETHLGPVLSCMQSCVMNRPGSECLDLCVPACKNVSRCN